MLVQSLVKLVQHSKYAHLVTTFIIYPLNSLQESLDNLAFLVFLAAKLAKIHITVLFAKKGYILMGLHVYLVGFIVVSVQKQASV